MLSCSGGGGAHGGRMHFLWVWWYRGATSLQITSIKIIVTASVNMSSPLKKTLETNQNDFS